MSSPGYTASQPEVLNRLARVEGQIRGLSRMVEQERYCIDVLTQIQAARAALDSIALSLLNDHVRNCMHHGNTKELDAKREELMRAVGRFVRS
jgi:CsoR family transcriptional regulator, copper-sensing transcriptional repressor